MTARLTNFKELQAVFSTNNEDLIESYHVLHDTGFNFKNNHPSFSRKEMHDLLAFINKISPSETETDDLNGFILGAFSKASGIREQFDVLRFGNNNVFNLELKSERPKVKNVNEDENEAIRYQLEKHQQYLQITCSGTVFVCTYLISENKFYTLDNSDSNNITEITIEELKESMSETKSLDNTPVDIDLSSFVVSPYSDSDEFIQHKYFLTDEQKQIRDAIFKSSETNNNIFLKGGAGTGKTLLLFDLAKKYIDNGYKVQIVSGAWHNNLEQISKKIGIDIFAISNFSNKFSDDTTVLLIDESQRMYQDSLNDILILSKVKKIFCYDKAQILHELQENNNYFLYTPEKDFKTFSLKERLRSDPELASFIQALISNKKSIAPFSYEHISVHYSNNQSSAKNFIKNKINSEHYVSIEPTPYITLTKGIKKRPKIYEDSKTAHDAMGLEFDNVIVVIDNYYEPKDEGVVGTYNSYYPYMQMRVLFEALTRVKKNLIVLIVENPSMYTYVQEIITSKETLERNQYNNYKDNEINFTNFTNALKSDTETKHHFDMILSTIEKMAENNEYTPLSIINKLSATEKKKVNG